MESEMPKSCPIRPKLWPLMQEAQKYDKFEEFSSDYSLDVMRGKYWHLTNDANFTIDKSYIPTDMSTLAGPTSGPPGLMVTGDPELWREYFPGRKYIAKIDLSKAKKGKDFAIVNRGFGHEIFVWNTDTISVKKVEPISKGLEESKEYDKIIPQSEKELKSFWEQKERCSK